MISKPKATSSLASLKAIRRIKAPTKEPGQRWAPIPHSDLVDDLFTAVRVQNWRVLPATERCAISENQMELAVSYGLVIPGVKLPQVPAIGLLNSNNKRRGLTMAVGFHGLQDEDTHWCGRTWTIGAHEQDLNVLACLHQALDQYSACLLQEAKHYDAFDVAELHAPHVHGILATVGQRRLLPWSRIGIVHRLVADAKRLTALDLYRAFAQVARLSPGVLQMDILAQFRELLSAILHEGKR